MTDEPEYDLVLPFVTVKSKGGPHDDDAYTAGFAMGHLDGHLGTGMPAYHETLIHAASRQQADLIAMRHGYRLEVLADDGDWLTAAFTYAVEEPK